VVYLFIDVWLRRVALHAVVLRGFVVKVIGMRDFANFLERVKAHLSSFWVYTWRGIWGNHVSFVVQDYHFSTAKPRLST